MKASYQFDIDALNEMEVEISLKCKLIEWRAIVATLDRLGSGATWPIVEPVQRIIMKIDEETGRSYAATRYEITANEKSS
jgi:hypothetical protein